MKPAKKIRAKKHRGRPATGQGVQIGTRWPEATVAQIDAWASGQKDTPARSESIRRLVDIGLGKPASALAVTSAAKAFVRAGSGNGGQCGRQSPRQKNAPGRTDQPQTAAR